MRKVIYSRLVTFKATEEINELLEKLAHELRLTKSEVIRRAIIHYAKELGIYAENVKYVYISEPGRGRRKEYKGVDVVVL
jgi:Ribbon-helix-helix protein, copG family.